MHNLTKVLAKFEALKAMGAITFEEYQAGTELFGIQITETPANEQAELICLWVEQLDELKRAWQKSVRQ